MFKKAFKKSTKREIILKLIADYIKQVVTSKGKKMPQFQSAM